MNLWAGCACLASSIREELLVENWTRTRKLADEETVKIGELQGFVRAFELRWLRALLR